MVMAAFDPWASGNESKPSVLTSNSFEDNFTCGLPDSAQYIASLERKLKLLGKSKVSNNRELLESLEEKKNDVVVRLLSEDNFFGESFTDENIPTKWLKSYINPEQPLTVGELLSLVKEDYLAKASEEPEKQGEDDSVE